MKTNLKNMLGLAALCLTLFANAMPTWAGSVSAPEVYIGTRHGISSYAQGSMGGARYSADSLQDIGCHMLLYPAPTTVTCYARKSADSAARCTTTVPHHVEAVQAMTDSSYIYFEVDYKKQCSVLSITNSSGFLK